MKALTEESQLRDRAAIHDILRLVRGPRKRGASQYEQEEGLPMKPPLTDLEIRTADKGFYGGFSKDVTITGKLLIGGLIIWAVGFPEHAGTFLDQLNGIILVTFKSWYVYSMAAFLLVCIALALVPATGRLRLGLPEDRPEFGNFSWISMMFGAGVGIGVLTYAAGEPLYHFQNNPDVIRGIATSEGADNVRPAFAWAFSHWGLSAWGCYALTGLALAFFSYRRGLPLTIRSALAPIFGERLSGKIGTFIDIVAVVATTLGVSQTLGYGVEQFVAGLSRVGVGGWLLQTAPDGSQSASNAGIIAALAVIVGASTLSALSGVGKGIKWLSNINMVLSAFLLVFFLIFGSTFFGLQALGFGIVDYVTSLPQLLFTVWHDDGTATGDALAAWQGSWTVFYWAWWIAFAPFVGMFLARISKGRTLREYVAGALLVPSIVCFVWFALVGGTAVDLELSGAAQGVILGSSLSDQLYATVGVLMPPTVAWILWVVIVVLLMTYLVTSVDSAILIINTINAGGDESPKSRPHILFWGTALAVVVGSLLMVGGLDAIQTAMVIGALPFSVVLGLMGISLIKAVIRDAMRRRQDIPVEAELTVEPALAESRR